MFCTKCGVQLRADDRFCSQCGCRTGLGRIVNSPRALMLDKRNRKIAGVCAGFARYLEVDVTLIRVLWLAAAIAVQVFHVGFYVDGFVPAFLGALIVSIVSVILTAILGPRRLNAQR